MGVMGVIRLHCRPARISRQLGQIGGTKIPYSWLWWWTVGLIVLTRGDAAEEADQESVSHISFSALMALVVVEKYKDG